MIVVGHVYTSEYEDRDGNRRSSLEMRATSVGPDLSRAIVRIEKPGYTGPDADPAAAPGPVGAAAEEDPAADDDQVESGDAGGPGPLPISA